MGQRKLKGESEEQGFPLSSDSCCVLSQVTSCLWASAVSRDTVTGSDKLLQKPRTHVPSQDLHTTLSLKGMGQSTKHLRFPAIGKIIDIQLFIFFKRWLSQRHPWTHVILDLIRRRCPCTGLYILRLAEHYHFKDASRIITSLFLSRLILERLH